LTKRKQMSSSSSTTQSNKENETTKNIDEDIFLSLEPFEDRQIDHFEEDGKEIYVKKMDDEENFAKIVNRLDYLIDQNISFDHVDQITLYEPKLREPQRTNPWVKPRSRLHESIMQIRQLHEFTDSIVSTGDRAQEEMNLGAGMDDEAVAKKFLGVKQIDDEDRYDERWDNDAEFVNSIYRTKKNQIEAAANILKKGASQVREKLTKDRQFHNQIFQLQKRWLVKASKTKAKQVFSPIAYSSNAILGNASLIIDLSKSSTILPLYSYIPVVLLRSQDNELDMKIPAICNYGKRVILASRVIRDGIFSNFDQILESAQASVFNLELFDLFVACLMSNKCVERDIHVLSYTMHTVTVKIGSIVQISLSRVPDSRNLFWDLECQTYFPIESDSFLNTTLSGDYVKCLLKESLVSLHEKYREVSMTNRQGSAKSSSTLVTLDSINNTEFAGECVTAFTNVLKHVNHRYCCQQMLGNILALNNYKDIVLDSSRFPLMTSYRLSLTSGQIFTIVVNGTTIVAQIRERYHEPHKPKVKADFLDEYQLSTKSARLLEFDAPSEFAEYLSILP